MVFPSIEFAVFFPLVFAASWLLMPRPRLWKPFVLACSYVFYAAADARFCLLLAGVTLVNQLCAQLIVRTEDVRRRKLLVGLGVGADLLVLGVFKYYGFFAEQVDGVLGDVGLSPGVPLLSLALPVGLSFFTFQAISYVVDVHRGLCRPSSTSRGAPSSRRRRWTSRCTWRSSHTSSPGRSCGRASSSRS
jgi:D-alanyl-lipoteichoic acid acyltransferase DltB (MBOAT superfamily)